MAEPRSVLHDPFASNSQASSSPITGLTPLLRRMGVVWFAVTAVGQVAFIGFILLQFVGPMLSGDLALWNDKPLIDGHIAGDRAGNAMFAAHVLLAAVMTGAGLLQLLPALRRRAPVVHRWTGRIFAGTAALLALGGFWLVWVRGTQLSMESALFVSLNGVIVLVCVAQAVRYAMRREFAIHQRWAMRAFLAASGVWFLRVLIMAWSLINQGPRGMNMTLSGPGDLVVQFGAFVLPLLVYELYRRAQVAASPGLVLAGVATMAAAVAVTAIGVFGAMSFMWLPYL